MTTVPESHDHGSTKLAERIANDHRRAKLRRVAAAFGSIALFGTATFLGLSIAGTVTVRDVVGLVAAIASGIAAFFVWRDSSRDAGANEEAR